LKPVDYFSLDGTLYRIPAYQPTDYASTPPEVWGAPFFLIPYGWYCLSVAGHDSAYQNLLLVVHMDGSVTLANLTEEKSNALLLEMMQSLKPQPTLEEKAQMDEIYRGVTIGGWHAYKEDRS
jgi:hypothetical protein